MELRKRRRELEEAQKEFDLRLQRAIDKEGEKLEQSIRKEVVEEQNLKTAEKDKVIADMKRQIDELKRKSEIGSQQLQGEVLELELENLLSREFPYDEIVPIPKGVHGGDVTQRVFDETGVHCGTILWESKRTKTWSDKWLPKLRDDQRAVKSRAGCSCEH